MKKNPTSTSGLFNPRVFLAFGLCFVGALLAMLSLAAPTPSSKTAAQTTGELKPVVSKSVANGISRAVRDLPIGPATGRLAFEHDLLRVRPNRPVSAGFVDPAVQTSAGALAMPTPNLTFEGMNQAEGCGGCIPPDTNGAVGLTQYVQMVNSSFSVYSKTGTRLSGPTPINALFSTLPATSRCHIDNNGDPVVIYDQLADRWLLSQFAINGGSGPWDECIAISKTPDATGEYYIYDFPLSTTRFEDYPHFGLWPDAYYMSTHEFNAAGTAYVGAAAWAFERAKMLAGQPAQLLYFPLDQVNSAFKGHLPANLDGFALPPAGAPNYFAQVDSSADTGLGNGLRIWKFHVDWTNPMNSTFGVSGQPNSITPVTDFARPNCMNYAQGCVPQLGDAFQLDPIGDRLMFRVAYRNFGDHESLVLNHTVVANANTGQMGPRWYEVRDPGGTPTIFQQSTWGPTGMTDLLYRWMSSIAMDHSGDIAIGYSTSNQINFPSIAYAGRLPGDPVSTLGQGEAQLFAGSGPQHGELFAPQFGRWGDYSDLTIDPADDCTFWYTNEYYAQVDATAGNWHTRVGSFKFPSCVASTPPTGTPALHPSGSALVTESCLPSNGTIDPGEQVSVSFCVRNLGSANTTNLVAALAATGGVTNPSSPQTYGALTAVGAAVCKTFTFTAANQACGSQITASLQLQDGAFNLGTATYNFTLGALTATFSQNFDGVTAPALPAGWTATNQPPTLPTMEPLWVTSTSGPDSPPNAAFVNDSANPADKTLDSPAFMITSSSATLTFRNSYDLENGFDGGVLEIKIGTGSFTDWLTAGGTFTANGYNGTITNMFGNPIVIPPATTRPAWTGNSGGYVTTTGTFPASANGQMVQLRFREGSDTTGNATGWHVDSIAVDPSVTCCNVVVPTSVVSRMTHGSITTPPFFDIKLPLTGTRGVECRRSTSLGAGNYTLVFTFPNNLTSVAGAQVTAHDPATGTGTVSSSVMGPGLNQYTVNLSNVSSGQYITVTLNSVLDVTGAGSNVIGPQMGVLVGDVNADGGASNLDVSLVKAKVAAGASVDSSNFRDDVNADGGFSNLDVSITKAQVAAGQTLPSPP